MCTFVWPWRLHPMGSGTDDRGIDQSMTLKPINRGGLHTDLSLWIKYTALSLRCWPGYSTFQSWHWSPFPLDCRMRKTWFCLFAESNLWEHTWTNTTYCKVLGVTNTFNYLLLYHSVFMEYKSYFWTCDDWYTDKHSNVLASCGCRNMNGDSLTHVEVSVTNSSAQKCLL